MIGFTCSKLSLIVGKSPKKPEFGRYLTISIHEAVEAIETLEALGAVETLEAGGNTLGTISLCAAMPIETEMLKA